MSAHTDKLTERVASATERLAALKARQLLRELRAEHQAKRRARRNDVRRRLDLGGAVLTAECGDFTLVEVIGLLIDAKERLGPSPTMMLAMKKKGQERLASAASTTGDGRHLDAIEKSGAAGLGGQLL
jgi:hypothetical protein